MHAVQNSAKILRLSGKGIFNKIITLIIRLLQIAGTVLKKACLKTLYTNFFKHMQCIAEQRITK